MMLKRQKKKKFSGKELSRLSCSLCYLSVGVVFKRDENLRAAIRTSVSQLAQGAVCSFGVSDLTKLH